MNETATRVHEVDQRELRRIAAMGDGGRILSLFASLDLPQVRTPRSLGTELESRLDEAEGRLAAELDESGAEALAACLGQARHAVGEADLSDHDLHGIAVFCKEGAAPHAYALRRPLSFPVSAAFGERPSLEPLLEALPGPSWAVALVSRTHGRVFLGTDTGLAEVAHADDEVHRWHAQGGWSQARFQRGVEKEARDHVDRVCALLFALFERRRFDHLAIGGPPEIWHQVEERLHPYLRERLSGRLRIDVETASADQVLEHLQPFVRIDRDRVERRAIERLGSGLGTGTGAVAGLQDVTDSLREGRVETLLVGGGPLDQEVERAIAAAVDQSAEVLVFENGSLEPFDGIAALLRY